MVHKLTKKQEKVELWKNKLTKCSFVLAAISSIGIASSVLPFLVGPPPEFHGQFPGPHGQFPGPNGPPEPRKDRGDEARSDWMSFSPQEQEQNFDEDEAESYQDSFSPQEQNEDLNEDEAQSY